MRDRLFELLWCASREYSDYTNEMHETGLSVNESYEEFTADYLLKNGAIVPPYKLGQTVYVVDKGLSLWWEGKTVAYYQTEEDELYMVKFRDKTRAAYSVDDIYPTKEEASQELRRGESDA